jgi:O-antigen/teichoic acid export membrane protein
LTDAATGSPSLSSRLARLTEVFPLVAFRGLNGGMPILIGLFIGHEWGLAALGAYTLASAVVAIGLMFVDWGCTRWLPRELALAHLQENAPSGAATANALRLTIAAAFLLLTWLFSAVGRIPGESTRFALELSLLYPISIFSVNGVSDRIVRREIGGIGIAVAAGVAVFIALGWSASQVVSGPHTIVLAFVVGKGVEALLLMHGRGELFRVAPRRVLAAAVALWPFSVQAILGAIYSRLSIFIVEHFRHADLGLIGAATALQNVLLLLPVSIALLTYPALVVAAARGDSGRIRSSLTAAAVASLAGVSVSIGALGAGRALVGRLLHIPPASMTFVIVYATIAYLTIGTTLAGVSLQAIGRERTTAGLSLVTLAVSLGMQFTFVRWLGLWGVPAGIATAEMVSVILFGSTALRAIRDRSAVPSPMHAVEVPAPESLQH